LAPLAFNTLGAWANSSEYIQALHRLVDGRDGKGRGRVQMPEEKRRKRRRCSMKSIAVTVAAVCAVSVVLAIMWQTLAWPRRSGTVLNIDDRTHMVHATRLVLNQSLRDDSTFASAYDVCLRREGEATFRCPVCGARLEPNPTNARALDSGNWSSGECVLYCPEVTKVDGVPSVLIGMSPAGESKWLALSDAPAWMRERVADRGQLLANESND
jgi:hypothetical protein